MTPIDLELSRAERLPALALAPLTPALVIAIARMHRCEIAADRAFDAYLRHGTDRNRERWLDARDRLELALAARHRAVSEAMGRRWLRVVEGVAT